MVAITGIGEEIPGFPDGLMATRRGEGLSLELVVWPERGDRSVRSVPYGVSSPPDPVDFDVSGRLSATLLPMPDAVLLPMPDAVTGILYAGVPEAATILSLDVTGYAWHDTDPATLAYTTFRNGETLLWVTRGNLAESDLIGRAVGIAGGVVAWGDWGFGLQDGENLAQMTATGEIDTMGTGRIVGSDGRGGLVVDDGAPMVMNAGGPNVEMPGVSLEGPVLDAEFSPDGNRLGLLTVEGLTVVPLDDGTEAATAMERPGMPQVVWSSDGRYALYPGLRGIVVLDTTDGVVRELMPTDIVTGLGLFDFDGQ